MGKDNIDSGMTVGLQEELLADLTLELEDSDNFQSKALLQKIMGAIREVKTARNYPSHYSDLQIERDLYHFYPNIRHLALYDYNQIGAEFEESHGENSISRSWCERKELFNGVLPLSRI